MRIAYNLQDFQITGGPGWVESDRFDIIAKAEGELKPEERGVMMRALLSERFGLVTHQETRQLPVYDLVLAKPDGKLGDGLHRVDCSKDSCGGTMVSNTNLKANGITLPGFSRTLSAILAKIVNEKTGLEGSFNIDLTWSRDETTDTSHPSIFTALQEQLGLKLESAKGPVDVLVIDHVEHPTPD
jgi:uncharacterized protein (TIGR03435 family)